MVLIIYDKAHYNITRCYPALKIIKEYKPWRGMQLRPAAKGECEYEVLLSQSPGKDTDTAPGG